jgi:glycosyltransferase involved in cell wall biosynthesis
VLRQALPHGVCAARNRGVAEAEGSWIAFIDDDDLWAPDKLMSQVRAAEDESRGWAYVGAVNVSEDLRLLGGAPPAAPEDVVSALPRVNLIPGGCSGVIVRRDLLPGDPFDPSCPYAEDWDLWIRLSRLDRPARVSRPLVGYRVHAGNRSLDTMGMVAMLDVIEARYGGPADRATFYRHLARVCQRASRQGEALRFYLRAAAADHSYLRRDFLPDLREVAQGVGHRVRSHLGLQRWVGPQGDRARRPARRYAAQQSWIDQARPWLDELATLSTTRAGVNLNFARRSIKRLVGSETDKDTSRK